MTGWGNYYGAEPELKKDVLERLRSARKAGLTVGKVKEMSNGVLGTHEVFDMLEAKVLPRETWVLMDEILKEFGY